MNEREMVECKYCGRRYDDLSGRELARMTMSGPCPSDDCPGHETTVEIHGVQSVANGVFCSDCGGLVDNESRAVGYPRKCDECDTSLVRWTRNIRE